MKLPEEVSREQGEKLERIEEELEDVKRRLGRIWNAIETTDIEMADAPDRITERKKKTSELTPEPGRRRGDRDQVQRDRNRLFHTHAGAQPAREATFAESP